MQFGCPKCHKLWKPWEDWKEGKIICSFCGYRPKVSKCGLPIKEVKMNGKVFILLEAPTDTNLLEECNKAGFRSSMFVPSMFFTLQEDLETVKGRIEEEPLPAVLIGVGKGGYLIFNILLSPCALLVKKAVILSAPFNTNTWNKKHLSPEQASYYGVNPSDHFFDHMMLPPVLLLYGRTDPIVPHEQGSLALTGLRKAFEPGKQKPNVQLITLAEQGHDLLKDKETVRNIVEWIK